MKKLLSLITEEKNLMSELSVTALRVYFGLAMAFAHGIGKIPPSEKFVGGVTSLGFPAPEFFAWAAGLSEFLGGIMIAVGLLTRPAAAFMAVTMGVAAFGVHAEDAFRVKELALTYFFISLIFTWRGAGRYSIDRFLSK